MFLDLWEQRSRPQCPWQRSPYRACNPCWILPDDTVSRCALDDNERTLPSFLTPIQRDAGRRDCLGRISSIFTVATSSAFLPSMTVSPAFAESDPVSSKAMDDLERQCSGGTLMSEQVIPGAYQQPCMSLPVRSIPLRVSSPKSLTIQLQIQQQTAAAGSTGMAVWNSSLLLKRLLEQITVNEGSSWLDDQTLVELGCGTGLASIAAAYLGKPRQVLATDGNQAVVELAQRNIVNNCVTKNDSMTSAPYCEVISAIQLSWGLLNAMDYVETADWVFGSDLTYSPSNWRALAETMATILKPTGKVLYLSLGHAGFNANAEMEGFLSVVKEQGLVSLSPSDDEWPFQHFKSSLADLVLQQNVSPEERSILDGTGGVKVLVLGCKRFKRASKSGR